KRIPPPRPRSTVGTPQQRVGGLRHDQSPHGRAARQAPDHLHDPSDHRRSGSETTPPVPAAAAFAWLPRTGRLRRPSPASRTASGWKRRISPQSESSRSFASCLSSAHRVEREAPPADDPSSPSKRGANPGSSKRTVQPKRPKRSSSRTSPTPPAASLSDASPDASKPHSPDAARATVG